MRLHRPWSNAFLALLALLVVPACGETPPPAAPAPVYRPLPVSVWNGRYQYRVELALKAEPVGSVPVTVAVVRPQYNVTGSALAERRYRKVGQGFSTSMGVDMERILVSKGLKIKGPFPSFDEMTYSDKNTADLALAPTLFLEVAYKPVGIPLEGGMRSDPKTPVYVGEYEPGRHWMIQAYQIVVSGWISFVLQEPLSGVKLWIKKLELEEVQQNGYIAFAAAARGDAAPLGPAGAGPAAPPPPVAWAPGDVLYDGRPDSVATALKTYYEVALQKLAVYIDTQELLALQKKIQEIRAKWRVGSSG